MLILPITLSVFTSPKKYYNQIQSKQKIDYLWDDCTALLYKGNFGIPLIIIFKPMWLTYIKVPNSIYILLLLIKMKVSYKMCT